MTTQQMLDFFDGYMAYGLNNVLGTDATADQKVQQLDEAKRFVCEQVEWWDPSVTLTLVATERTVPLTGSVVGASLAKSSKRVFKIRELIINGQSIGAPVKYTEWDQSISAWRSNTDAGTPVLSMVRGTTLYLHPIPDAACVAAGANYVSGIAEAATLDYTSPDTVCELPDDLCRAIPYVAAIRAAEPVSETDSEMQTLARYGELAKRIIEYHAATMRNEATENPNDYQRYYGGRWV